MPHSTTTFPSPRAIHTMTAFAAILLLLALLVHTLLPALPDSAPLGSSNVAGLLPAEQGQAAAGAYSLFVSSSNTRSNPMPLADRTVSGDTYVFTSPDTGVYQVRFYLDNPNMTGAPRRTESNAPYDFAGGTVSTATPFSTATVANGSHTITAAVDLVGGGTEVVHAAFIVSNTAKAPDQVHTAWVRDPSTTLTVVWRTWNTATPSTVEYRALGSTTWLTGTGAARASGTTGKLHEVTISGLSPSTTYEYRVRGDSGVWSQVYSVRTAPALGTADFEAVYFADTGLIGRTDGLTTGTKQVIDEIAALNPLLLLPGGDYAYYNTDTRYGTLENSIDAWFNQMQTATSRSVMMPTYGNHEVLLGESYTAWANRFPTPAGYDGRRFYSFDIGDAHFVSIFAVYNTTGLTSAQLAWVEQDLMAARNAGRRWIIPYLHVSPYTDGTNHPSNLELRAQLGPLFERLGVKVVFTSHDQAYERTYPLTDMPNGNRPTSSSKSCYTMADGVTWVKTSPGGKLSNISKNFSPWAHATAPAWTAYRDNTMHHFSRLVVSRLGRIRVETYGVKGDGTRPVIQDSFEYTTGSCGADTTPPTVTNVSPGANVTGVATYANVTATFSEPVNASTVTAATFTLIKAGASTPIAATITYDAATGKATLNPSSDLPAGASYSATVRGGADGVKDLAGNPLAASKSWSFTTAVGGLEGEYYDNQDLTGLKLARVDPTVNFNWGGGSPDRTLASDTFSVRWTGQVRADATESYTFYTTSNDGVRLWVNGRLLIDNWTNHSATENSGSISLEAGQWYPVRLEYYEGAGSSIITLSHSSATVPKRIIPTDHLRTMDMASAGRPAGNASADTATVGWPFKALWARVALR